MPRKAVTPLKLRSLRKNVRGGCKTSMSVEQLDPFMGTKYPRDGSLASELTGSFLVDYLADTAPSAVKITNIKLRYNVALGPPMSACRSRPQNKTRRERLSPRIMMQERDE